MQEQTPDAASLLRSAGAWMSVLVALLMLVNCWRATSDPAGFARYFGVAAAADADPAFIYVYASRALFLAMITAILLWKRQLAALGYFAAAAIIMPICDAIQVQQAGGAIPIVARHLATAAYLAITAYLLHRWVARHG